MRETASTPFQQPSAESRSPQYVFTGAERPIYPQEPNRFEQPQPSVAPANPEEIAAHTDLAKELAPASQPERPAQTPEDDPTLHKQIIEVVGTRVGVYQDEELGSQTEYELA